jgi:adenylosuccinate lyase
MELNALTAISPIDGRKVLLKQMQNILSLITDLAKDNASIPMLSRTHGQRDWWCAQFP